MKHFPLFFLCLALSLSISIGYAQTFPDSQKDGIYYEVNGAKLWTVTHGDGPPLFFISGGPGGAHPGLRRFDSLYTTHTLVYYDALGRGKSDLAPDPSYYAIDRDIEDLEGLRKAMGFQKIAILGHSYGGVVAQGYAIRYPQNVSHLVIVNSFHSYLMWQANDDNCNHEIRTNYPEVWDTLMIVRAQGYISRDSIHQEIYGRVPYGFLYAYNPDKFVRRSAPSGPPYPNRFNADVYYQMVGKDGDFIVGSDIGNFDFRTQLRHLTMPVLVVGGRYDRVAVPREMIKYKDYCPQCEYVMFEKSGHNPQVEEPEAYFDLLRKFLAK